MGAAKKILGEKFPPGVEFPPENLVPETDREIAAAFSAVIVEFPTKVIAHIADTTDETVKDWRQGVRSPRFATAVRLARKVPKIKAAIYELIDGGNTNPQDRQLVRVLFDALVEISGTDGDAAIVARDALREFSTMTWAAAR